MNGFDPTTLPWLLPAPDDFRAQVKALLNEDAPVPGRRIRDLATHALDLNQCNTLARTVRKLGDDIDFADAISPLRLVWLGSGTGDFILPAIEVGALRHGVCALASEPGYGRAEEYTLMPETGTAPDIAVLAFDHRGLGLDRPSLGAGDAEQAVTAATSRLRAMATRLAARGIHCILQTIVPPAAPWAGHVDAVTPGSPRSQIDAANAAIRSLATELDATLFDVATLASEVGTARWFDTGLWNQAKAPFDMGVMPYYGDHLGRLLGALRGKSRKALVLDLDNTLWGGVIGDDGLDGIRIGQGSPEGEAHLELQQLALDLKSRGIVLAVCSKNDKETALGPFRSLEDMVLRENDIAVFIANWTDKATNLHQIAKTLNIGTDALVFVDDNPAERARVRQALPEVAIPELPEDPALYARLVSAAGYFETVKLSQEDTARAEQYRANAARASVLEEIGDMDTYLESLEMKSSIRPFDALGRGRIGQLINKTNQFNLTTRRYTPAEVEMVEEEADTLCLQIRLADRFGDNGMVSVVIFRPDGSDWVCDTWLMSCRVIGRRLEEAVLDFVVDAARKAGIARLIGVYTPTPRNGMVEDFWQKLGFAPRDAEANGPTSWTLDVAGYTPFGPPIEITADLDFPAGQTA